MSENILPFSFSFTVNLSSSCFSIFRLVFVFSSNLRLLRLLLLVTRELKATTTAVTTSLKKTLHVQHTFFVHLFAVVLHDYNVQKLPGYTFSGGNVVRVLVDFFFIVAHFHPGGR